MKKIKNKVICYVFAMLMVLSSTFSSAVPALAAEVSDNRIETTVDADGLNSIIPDASINASSITTYTSGTYNFSTFTFTNTNRGSLKRINGHQVKFKIYFKKADSQSTDIDLKFDFQRYYNTNGNEIYISHWGDRLRSETTSTVNGYHYFESDWIPITYGQVFSMYYDACTAWGYTGTGAYRSATVKLTMEVL